jgi:hypothetical protein
MSVFNRLSRFFGASTDGRFRFEPPWLTGHTVSYRLVRGDGSRFVMRLRCLGQNRKEPGAWVILADMREGDVQTVAMLRVLDQADEASQLCATPMHAETLFGDPGENPMLTVESAMVMAINLLNVRLFENIPALMSEAPSKIDGLCNIREVYSLKDPWPELGYDKVHELSSRVPLTGVVRSTLVGHNNELTLASYGCNKPSPDWPAYQDFVDWQERRPIRYENLEVILPETWLLAPLLRERPDLMQGDAKNDLGALELKCTEGGTTCSAGVHLSRYDSERELLENAAEDVIEHLRSDPRGDISEVIVDEVDGAGRILIFHSFNNPEASGLMACGIVFNHDKSSLAKVVGSLSVSNGNPGREKALMDARETFLEMIQSLRFVD